MTLAIPVEEAVERTLAVLRRQPAGLFTDIDGTISHVARTPGEAAIDASPRASLRSLSSTVDIVGVVTGRGAADAARMLGLDGPVVIGNHGYERLQRGERFIHPSVLGSRANVASSSELLKALVDSTSLLAGVVIENKDLSASVHYRLVEDQGRPIELLRMVVDAIAELHDLKVTEGKLVLEIRPKSVVNKGTAIHDIAKEMGLRGVVYLGDDVTDVDAFRTLRSIRSHDVATLSIGIISSESHAAVLETADLLIEGVDACIALLAEVAERMGVSVGEQRVPS